MHRHESGKLRALWYAYQALSHFVLIYPVYNLHFMASGLSIVEVAALQAIWILPGLVLEIPSGMLADRLGRKKAMLGGLAAEAACFAIWLAFPGFTGFAAGFILWGLGETFVSGAREALLYDALKAKGEEDEYASILGRGSSAAKLSTMLALLAGGMTYGASPAIALIASSAAMVAAGVFAALLPDVMAISEGNRPVAPLSAMLEDARSILADRAFLFLCAFAAVSSVSYGILDEFDQVLAGSLVNGTALVGIWGAVRYLAEAVGALLADKLARFASGTRKLLVLSALAGAMSFLPAVTRSLWTLPAYFAAFGLFSALEVALGSAVQGRIPSNSRATFLSSVSWSTDALGLPLVFAAGGLAQGSGIGGAFAFLGGVSALPLVGSLIALAFRKRR